MELFGRKKGISLLVPTQNVESIVELCLRSFAEFPDEIIVVDNGSIDGTIEIVRSLEKEFDHIRVYNKPGLKDLYENRQFALEQSRFNWIVRIDSDYVAYTSGSHDIRHLREKILKTPRQLRPLAFGITQVNLVHDFFHTGPRKEERDVQLQMHIDPPTNTLAARILQWFPGMKFTRIGRWEGVRFQKYLNHCGLAEPYWFHCSFKTNRDLLFRYYRTDWREEGNFDLYPTLSSYVEEKIEERFGTSDLSAAGEGHFQETQRPFLIPYDPLKYYPYPELISEKIEHMKN